MRETNNRKNKTSRPGNTKYGAGTYGDVKHGSKRKDSSLGKRVLGLGIFLFLILIGSLFFDDIADRLPFKLPWKDNSPVIEISQLIGMDIPEYDGNPYVIIDDNIPNEFVGGYDRSKYLQTGAYFSELDERGRCGAAWGVLDSSMMPSIDREEVLETKPSGWNPVKYDDLIEDGFLYNRCHLIGYQLTGENDNPLNLITGTRYFNVEGMLPFENKVAGYIRREEGRVFYRITPLYRGDELVARYVRMEAYSLSDHGIGVCFDVLLYNVQPGILIDYATGESSRAE